MLNKLKSNVMAQKDILADISKNDSFYVVFIVLEDIGKNIHSFEHCQTSHLRATKDILEERLLF